VLAAQILFAFETVIPCFGPTKHEKLLTLCLHEKKKLFFLCPAKEKEFFLLPFVSALSMGGF
jgi:hypothetical protein